MEHMFAVRCWTESSNYATPTRVSIDSDFFLAKQKKISYFRGKIWPMKEKTKFACVCVYEGWDS